jgi:glycosyltransferase involved in cell wall biosynthesis
LQKICFIINTLEFLNSHRLPLVFEARSKGFEVHIITNLEISCGEQFTEFTYHHVGFTRSGQNPFVELYSLFRIVTLLKKIRPDLVHLVTIKPVLYGGIAARIAGVKSVVAAISGLGSVFSASRSLVLLRLQMVKFLYRVALYHKSLAVIFQNIDDKEKLLSTKAVPLEKTHLIRGSGVSLADYPYIPEPEGVPVVSMAARLLREKGVCEFVGAARILKQRGVDVKMHVIGSPDPGNPSSVTIEEISAWEKEDVACFLGYRKDISTLYSQSNIVCLPSYYGEGLPKGLIEAAACGRAIITTDMPGCRDAIISDITGILVEPKDEISLADAIELIINDPVLRKSMGKAGRKLAKEAFTIEHVVHEHMNIYRKLMSHD